MRCLVVSGCMGLSLLLASGCGKSAPTQGGVSYVDQIAAARAEADASIRANKLTVIGYKQGSKSNDLAGSRRTLELAFTACGEIADPASRSKCFALLGAAQARLGNRTDALEALREANKSAMQEDRLESRVELLANLAAIYGGEALKDSSKAREVLTLAQETANKIEDPQSQAIALKDLGSAYLKTGDTAAAEKTLAEAIPLARKVEDLRKRSAALVQIGAVQLETSADAAATTFDEAVASARQIESLYSQVYALADIADRLIDVKQFDTAGKVLEEASAQVKNVPQADLQKETEDKVRQVSSKLPKNSS